MKISVPLGETSRQAGSYEQALSDAIYLSKREASRAAARSLRFRVEIRTKISIGVGVMIRIRIWIKVRSHGATSRRDMLRGHVVRSESHEATKLGENKSHKRLYALGHTKRHFHATSRSVK